MSEIVPALERFKQTSIDFGVPQQSENVRILATEATRTAVNADEFIGKIESTLGEPWKVTLLKKEDEGRVGALGVVSSVGGSNGLEGLVMDLGGMLILAYIVNEVADMVVSRWLNTDHMDDCTS